MRPAEDSTMAEGEHGRSLDAREEQVEEAFDAVEDSLRRVRRFGRFWWWLPMWGLHAQSS